MIRNLANINESKSSKQLAYKNVCYRNDSKIMRLRADRSSILFQDESNMSWMSSQTIDELLDVLAPFEYEMYIDEHGISFCQIFFLDQHGMNLSRRLWSLKF